MLRVDGEFFTLSEFALSSVRLRSSVQFDHSQFGISPLRRL